MSINLSTKKERYGHKLLFLSIILLAFFLRIMGIGWGLPHTNLHPDEGLIFYPAYENALNHSFEVRNYERPNHVSIKLNTLLYIGVQEIYFAPMDQHDFATNFNENISLFITLSRLLMLVFSLITVILSYLIGKYFGSKQALLSALLFAVFPPFVEHSHYITPDTPLLCFLMGVICAGLWYMNESKIFPLFLMSLLTAFATCEKYPGLYGCLIIAVVLCVTHFKRPILIISRGFLSLLFFLLSIMSISPILLIDIHNVIEAIGGQNRLYHLGADGLNFFQTVLFYIKTTMLNLGLILTFCFIYGFIKLFYKDVKRAIVLLILFLYILPISTLNVHWERYTLPIYGGALLFGAFGMIYLLEDLKRLILNISKNNINTTKNVKYKGVLTYGIYAMILILPICSLLSGSVVIVGSFLAPDNRISLQQTFSDLGITNQNSLYDSNTPLSPGGYFGVFTDFEDGDPERYKYQGSPKFIVTSSAQRDLYLKSDLEVNKWVANFYLKLDELYPLVSLFTPEIPSRHFIEIMNIYASARTTVRYLRGAEVGYEIRVYQLLP
jgi:hypothetical protein